MKKNTIISITIAILAIGFGVIYITDKNKGRQKIIGKVTLRLLQMDKENKYNGMTQGEILDMCNKVVNQRFGGGNAFSHWPQGDIDRYRIMVDGMSAPIIFGKGELEMAVKELNL